MIRLTSTLLISCTLAACGGGGGGGGNTGTSVSSPAPGPTIQLDKTGPSVGDFYTYKMSGYAITNVTSQYPYVPSYDTELTTAVVAGVATVKTLYGDQYTGYFDGSATLTGTYQAGFDAYCAPKSTAGAYGPPTKLTPNASWENATSITRDCGGGSEAKTSKLANKGAVVGIESITVAAGTFNAYKLVATVIDETTRYYANQTPTKAEILTTKVTSWIDVDTGVELKRSAEELADSKTSTRYDRDVVMRELVGMSHAKSGRQVLLVERFMGPGWTGTYSGALSGTCAAKIFADGDIEARCAQGTSTVNSFFPVGKIDASGQVSFAPPAGGANAPTFMGKAESLTKISGTWRDNAGATGTWVMTHDN